MSNMSITIYPGRTTKQHSQNRRYLNSDESFPLLNTDISTLVVFIVERKHTNHSEGYSMFPFPRTAQPEILLYT